VNFCQALFWTWTWSSCKCQWRSNRHPTVPNPSIHGVCKLHAGLYHSYQVVPNPTTAALCWSLMIFFWRYLAILNLSLFNKDLMEWNEGEKFTNALYHPTVTLLCKETTEPINCKDLYEEARVQQTPCSTASAESYITPSFPTLPVSESTCGQDGLQPQNVLNTSVHTSQQQKIIVHPRKCFTSNHDDLGSASWALDGTCF
jgi:hypothetical protein